MDHYLQTAFSTGAFLYLSGLAAASLFFAMVGLREIKMNCLEGLLYLALAVFFACAHAYLLYNSSSANSFISDHTARLGLWSWLAMLVAPTLIVLYLLLGIFNFITARVREGMIKAFFGLTLICYLYLLGSQWPMDVRGIMTLIWGGVWFNLELKTAP